MSPVLSVVHATHEAKELREDPKPCRVAEYACKEKPRNAAGHGTLVRPIVESACYSRSQPDGFDELRLFWLMKDQFARIDPRLLD